QLAEYPHGLQLIMFTRRAQWPLVTLCLILCLVLLILVISGRRRVVADRTGAGAGAVCPSVRQRATKSIYCRPKSHDRCRRAGEIYSRQRLGRGLDIRGAALRISVCPALLDAGGRAGGAREAIAAAVVPDRKCRQRVSG